MVLHYVKDKDCLIELHKRICTDGKIRYNVTKKHMYMPVCFDKYSRDYVNIKSAIKQYRKYCYDIGITCNV